MIVTDQELLNSLDRWVNNKNGRYYSLDRKNNTNEKV